MPSTLRTERDGRVLTVFFDTPLHNFMGRSMVRELDELIRSFQRDRSIRSVVLTGARQGLFITHYEIAEILAGAEGVGPPPPRPVAAALVRVAGALKHMPGVRALVERTPVRGLLELHRAHDLFRRMNRSDKIFVAVAQIIPVLMLTIAVELRIRPKALLSGEVGLAAIVMRPRPRNRLCCRDLPGTASPRPTAIPQPLQSA